MYEIIKEASKFHDELISEGFNHETAAAYVTKFFDRRLLDRAEAGKLLEESGPKKVHKWGGSLIP